MQRYDEYLQTANIYRKKVSDIQQKSILGYLLMYLKILGNVS